jgi:hypothetical protein
MMLRPIVSARGKPSGMNATITPIALALWVCYVRQCSRLYISTIDRVSAARTYEVAHLRCLQMFMLFVKVNESVLYVTGMY